jgi:hypothetical protein
MDDWKGTRMTEDAPASWSEAESPEDALEDAISQMERPIGADGATTASEGRRGRSLEDALAAERPGSVEDRRPNVIVDRDLPDDEAEMIADEVSPAGRPSPEEAAMRETDEAPGATWRRSDGYGDDV